jgi:hypothetical protein
MSYSPSPSISTSTSSLSPIDGTPVPFLPLRLHGRNTGGQNIPVRLHGDTDVEESGARCLNMDDAQDDEGVDTGETRREKASVPDSESEGNVSGLGSESVKTNRDHNDDYERGESRDQDSITAGTDRETKDSDMDKNIHKRETTGTCIEHREGHDDGAVNKDSDSTNEESNIKSSEGNQGKDQGAMEEEHANHPVKSKDQGASNIMAKNHGGVNVGEETETANRQCMGQPEETHANVNHAKEGDLSSCGGSNPRDHACVNADQEGANIVQSDSSSCVPETQSRNTSTKLSDEVMMSESESGAAKKPGGDVDISFVVHTPTGTVKDSDTHQNISANKDSDLGRDVAAHTPRKKSHGTLQDADLTTGS